MTEQSRDDLDRSLRECGARYVVDTQGQRIAVLLTVEEYEHYLDLLDDEADSQDAGLVARLAQAADRSTGGEPHASGGTRTMAKITLSDILDDLRAADQVLRKFEQRYWISSPDFYELYSQGQLDDGQHREDFSEWAGFYKLKLKREAALEQLSQRRLEHLRSQATGETIELLPEKPVLELA